MLIYIIILSALLLQFLFCRNDVKNDNEIAIRIGNNISFSTQRTAILFIIDAALLIFIAAFRNQTVGTDTKAYFYWIEQIQNFSFFELYRWVNKSGIAIGFAVVSKILFSIFHSKEIVLITINTIIFTGIYKFSREHGSNFVFTIYLFLTLSMYNQSMNITGQYVAAVFLLLSIDYLHKREIKQYVVCVLLASAFHSAAVFGLIFIFADLLKNRAVRNSIIIIIVSFTGSLFAPRVINAIVSKTIYSVYLYKETGSESGIGLAMNILIFIVFAVFYKQFQERDEYAHIWLYSVAITIGLNFYISELAMIGRMMIFFKMTYLVSIPSYINSFKDKKMRSLIRFVAVILFGVYYWHSIHGSCYGTTPYLSDILGIR